MSARVVDALVSVPGPDERGRSGTRAAIQGAWRRGICLKARDVLYLGRGPS